MEQQDFSRFWRVPEGGCELLAARYSARAFGRHSHERYAVGVIGAGVEKLFYRGTQHLGTAGSIVTLTPGEMHDGVPGSAEGWSYRMLYLDPQWLNRAVFEGRFGDGHIHLFQLALTHDMGFAQAFLHQHQVIEQSCSSLERESVLLHLVSQLFERCGGPQPRAVADEREVVRRVRQMLDEQYAQNIALNDLAQWVGLDPLYLIRVFKKSVGVSPHSYQIQTRVARVQQLLRSGVGIAEASLRCGFFDQSHMTRAFKKVVGITPGCFQRG